MESYSIPYCSMYVGSLSIQSRGNAITASLWYVCDSFSLFFSSRILLFGFLFFPSQITIQLFWSKCTKLLWSCMRIGWKVVMLKLKLWNIMESGWFRWIVIILHTRASNLESYILRISNRCFSVHFLCCFYSLIFILLNCCFIWIHLTILFF